MGYSSQLIIGLWCLQLSCASCDKSFRFLTTPARGDNAAVTGRGCREVIKEDGCSCSQASDALRWVTGDNWCPSSLQNNRRSLHCTGSPPSLSPGPTVYKLGLSYAALSPQRPYTSRALEPRQNPRPQNDRNSSSHGILDWSLTCRHSCLSDDVRTML
jgi:hypothetical protein